VKSRPSIVSSDGHFPISVANQCVFIDAIRQVSRCVAKDEVRYAINGIGIDFNKNDGCNVTGTDGHRLETIKLDCLCDTDKATIMYPQVVDILEALYGDTHMIKFNVGDRGMNFYINGNIMLEVPEVEGTFPKYKEIIPEKSSSETTITAKAMKLYNAAIGIHAMHKAVKSDQSVMRLVINGSNKVAYSGDVGESFINVTYEALFDGEKTGDDFDGAFNSGYFADMMKPHTKMNKDVTIELIDPERPAVLRTCDTIHVLMPIKIKS